MRRAARQSKTVRFTALLHHITTDLLKRSYLALARDAAPGIDGVTWQAYGESLEEKLKDLHDRVHRGSYRARPIAAPMHSIVQVLQFLFEGFPVGLPCHAIDSRRSVTREREIAPLEEIGGDVMQQGREPYRLALSRRSAHGCQPVRRGIPAQCPGRGRLTAVPLG